VSKREQYAEILGVRPNASSKEIKKAYRDLCRVWQPERFSDQPRRQREAEEKLQKITEAYQHLQALHRRAQQQATQSQDREKPASSQSAKTPEVIDSSDQQTPQPEVRPAPADRQLARLPKPKQPFIPVPLPPKPAPGRFVFFTLSAIAVGIILLLILTQLYEQTKTEVSSSQQTPGTHLLPRPSSREDLINPISPAGLSASLPTSQSVSKSPKPTDSGLDPESRSTAGKRASEARNTTEQ